MIYRETGQFKTTYASDQQLFPILQDRAIVIAFLVFAFVAVPYLASDYLFRAIITPFLILSLAALGLNILVGYCGQLSLGTGGFMAVGAYAAYNLAVRFPGLNLLVVFILATIRSVQTFDEIYILTGGGPGSATKMLVHYIYETGFAVMPRNYGLAAAASLLLGAVLFLFTALQMRLSRGGRDA